MYKETKMENLTADYIIFEGFSTKNKKKVLVSVDGGKSFANLPLGLEYANHSPDGFNWGYNGSGPNQLGVGIALFIAKVYDGFKEDSPYFDTNIAIIKNLVMPKIQSIKDDKWQYSYRELVGDLRNF